MPLTLLALYRSSESIYVGKYDSTVDGDPTEDTADYTAVPMGGFFSMNCLRLQPEVVSKISRL